MTARTANLQSDFTARLPWTAPVVRELFYDEARDRRWEFEDPLPPPKSEIAVQPPARPLKHLPHVVADLRAADVLERYARELLNEAAELRARASGETPADDEMVSIAEIATMMKTTEDAARKQIKRVGVGVKIAGRLYAPRTALASLYVRNVHSNVAFVQSLRPADSGTIAALMEIPFER